MKHRWLPLLSTYRFYRKFGPPFWAWRMAIRVVLTVG
jgi:hypothetical protein